MLISCRARVAVSDAQIAREVSEEHAALHCLIGWARGRVDAAARASVA